MDRPQRTVAGEPLEDLAAVLSGIEVGEIVDGLVDMDLRLTDDEAVILRRALMRLEAELLLDDADALTAGTLAAMRTSPKRQHDAFMLLVERMIEAAEQA
jgi:hypothetical protein